MLQFDNDFFEKIIRILFQNYFYNVKSTFWNDLLKI